MVGPVDRMEAEALLQSLTGGNLPSDIHYIRYVKDIGWVFAPPTPSDWTTISASSPSGTPRFGTGSLWVKTA